MKKIFGIFICMLLILPVFSFTTRADPGPKLEISITGSLPLPLYRFIVGGVIINTGDTSAYNISYEMIIKGGFDNSINETIQGYEPEIYPNYALGIAVNYIQGFGPVIITLTASASNAETGSATAKGFQIGRFTWVPFSWLFDN